MSDIPIINPEWASDERKEGVFIVDSGADWKVTVEGRGDHWLVVHWEIYEHDGRKMWLDRSSYTIGKELVRQLAALES